MKYSWFGIGVAVLVALLPFLISTDIFYGSVNAKVFWVNGVSALLLGALGLYLITSKEERAMPFSLMAIAITVVFLIHVLAAQLGIFPERSWWSDILRSTGLIFLAHVLALGLTLGLVAVKEDWSLIRRTVLIGAGLFSLGTILGVGGLGYTGTWLGLPFFHEGFTFGNSTFAGTYLVLAAVLGLIELFYSWNNRKVRVVLLCALFAVLLSPILLGLRSFIASGGELSALMGAARTSSVALYAFLGVFGVWLLLGRFLTGKAALMLRSGWILITLGGVVIGLALLFVPGSVVQEQYIEYSSAARLIVWESGMEAVADRPSLGWGPENFNQAFEMHHDSRLYLKENIGEIWFDRAHNVFVDTLVTIGVLGMISIISAVGVFSWVVYRAYRRGSIGSIEAFLLLGVVIVHIVQLQTSFDTVGSYVLVALLGGYAVYLERVSGVCTYTVPPVFIRILGALLILGALASFWFVIGAEQMRQHALRGVFVADSVEKEHELIAHALSRKSDFESLRLSSDSFLSGGLDALAGTQSPEMVLRIQQTIPLYEQKWNEYLREAPDHYRARINLAYLLLVKTVLGEPSLDEADKHIAKAYEISPGNPLTYIVDGLSHLYRGDLDGAELRIGAAVAVNPGIELSQAVAEYLEKQKAQFPRITLFRLESI